MHTVHESAEAMAELPTSGRIDGAERAQIVAELERILASRYFRSAGRSRQFLQYVVQFRLDGRHDQLKERTIGTEVFQRPADYATGEDPVVRVQAGEVRRRLEQFYQGSGETASVVRIELPLGSYAPTFRWAKMDQLPEEAPPPTAEAAVPIEEPRPSRRKAYLWIAAAIAVVVLGLAVFAGLHFHRAARQQSAIREFWTPIFATEEPVLICLSNAVSYRPSLELYHRYSQTHPGTYKTEVDRSIIPLEMDPNTPLKWGDLVQYSDYGVAVGDVQAAIKLSSLFGRIGKTDQVRIGSHYSFQDLRNSPSVVVGAFNNKWTMQLTSNLHFAFVERESHFLIREQIPGGRQWEPHPIGPGQSLDYALVGRLLDSKTGQFTVAAAGITGAGTEAAGEFLSNPEILEQGLRNAPTDWPSKNAILVLESTVTDGVPCPPHVIASYYW